MYKKKKIKSVLVFTPFHLSWLISIHPLQTSPSDGRMQLMCAVAFPPQFKHRLVTLVITIKAQAMRRADALKGVSS